MNFITPKHRPFLKWAGNKYRCLSQIIPQLPKNLRLIEPFTGSGAIFLNTQFSQYLLADNNPHLIQLYQILKLHGIDFIEYCKQWFQPQFNHAEPYYEFRKTFNYTHDLYLKAALFLYLNRHGFNGLCRFNQKGTYNVPFGSYAHPYFPQQEMLHFHHQAQWAELICNDYQTTFLQANPNDVIYCDPPYHPINKTAKFTAYTPHCFHQAHQEQLQKLALTASQQGIHVLISNHDTHYTRQLYRQATQIYSFEVTRSIAAMGSRRTKVKELLAHFAPQS